MNSKIKVIIYLVIFALFIGAAGFAYNYLSERYKTDDRLGLNRPGNETPAPGAATEKPAVDAPANTPGTPEDTDAPEDDRIKAPDFTMTDADGNKVKLSDYFGTPIVLNFWASWCPPCKEEMPHFNKVSEEYDRDELIFLMVDLVDGQRETVKKGKAYIEDNGFTFTVLYDTLQEGAMTYGIRAIPSTLFIDSEGYIQAGLEGAMDEELLRRGIEFILPAP